MRTWPGALVLFLGESNSRRPLVLLALGLELLVNFAPEASLEPPNREVFILPTVAVWLSPSTPGIYCPDGAK